MKKMFLFSAVLFVIAVVIASCGASKAVQPTTQPTQQSQKPNPGGNGLGTRVQVPCVQESYDDSLYFRGLGTATHVNMQNARSAALLAAKEEIIQKLGGFVEGMESYFVQSLAGSAPSEDIGRAARTIMDKAVQETLNHAEKTCEDMYDAGYSQGYKSFIALQIPKKKLVDNMVKGLSEDEITRRHFDEDQYRKFAEKRMQELLEHRDKYQR